MPATFTIKQNDQLPEIVASCIGSNGLPVDLTGATSVVFHMTGPSPATSTKVNAAGTIVNYTAGQVKYSWAAADTDTVGTFNAEFEVVFPTSKKMTFPNYENISVVVVDDLL